MILTKFTYLIIKQAPLYNIILKYTRGIEFKVNSEKFTGEWYKQAVFYQLNIRAFFDSDGDGIGDIKGAISKLDYIASLGIDCIWIMPIHPSPLKDDGYDVADFYGIHEDLGDLDDFHELVNTAHSKGIGVIMDLVLNHTSSIHEWFKDARSSRNSRYRDYYVWSDTDSLYSDVPIIFSDYEDSNWSWDSGSGQYYWHRFYSTQPDLNYDNPKVHEEMLNVARFWLSKGVDGFRLDAIPYLFEREGTECSALSETHNFCRSLRTMMKAEYPNAVIFSEANQSEPKEIVRWFGNGDEFHMCLNFYLSSALFADLAHGQPRLSKKAIPYSQLADNSTVWLNFLRNHDDLDTSSIPTDARLRVLKRYGKTTGSVFRSMNIRRRLAPMLDNDKRRWLLLICAIFAIPGTPLIYNGDEIGMGDDLSLTDRYTVRTPMQWDCSTYAGFTTADKPYIPIYKLGKYGYENVNAKAQESDPNSYLSTLRKIIKIYKQSPALGQGNAKLINIIGKPVLAFHRFNANQDLICIFNFSMKPCSPTKELLFKDRHDILGFYNYDPDTYRIPPYACFWMEKDVTPL